MKLRAFTLIEIIVSLAIFAVVAVIAVGALIRVTSANRQAQAIQGGINNISFVLDAISREMRVGTSFSCVYGTNLNNMSTVGTACSASTRTNTTSPYDTRISFVSSNPDSTGNCNLTYAYIFHVPSGYLATTTIYKAEATTCSNINSVTPYPVISSSVNINNYYISPPNPAYAYPYKWIRIRLNGYVGTKIKDQSIFDVQTSISERTHE